MCDIVAMQQANKCSHCKCYSTTARSIYMY